MLNSRRRTASRSRATLFRVVPALCVAAAAALGAAAQEVVPPSFPELWAALQDDAVVAAAAPSPAPSDFSADVEDRIQARKSYAIPAFEIVGFDVLVNLANRYTTGDPYHSNLTSIRHNLHHKWVTDNDPFNVNQFWHPYQGSMYHGFARSAGLDFWPSLGYTFAGSAFWEIAGETTPPSRNDQIASGIAGSFLGEALFRMASLLLEGGGDTPGFWRELGATVLSPRSRAAVRRRLAAPIPPRPPNRRPAAALISPATGFNRLAFGDRFKPIFPSHDPTYYSRVAFGAAATTQNEPGASTRVKRNEAQVDVSMDYGLPGKPGYTYKRPFDYFAVLVGFIALFLLRLRFPAAFAPTASKTS